MDLKLSPLNEEHIKLEARLEPFGGWSMPIQYKSIIAEHHWTRKSASLFDICHMGEIVIYGDPQKTNLDKVVTVNLNKMQDNKCRYGFILNGEGRIIDDLVVYKINKEKYMLVVNAATTQKDEEHLRRHLSGNYKLENISAKLGKIDLQGPLSREILKLYVDASLLDKLKFYNFGHFLFQGEKAIVSRTGYTGELGYELYLSVEKTVKFWASLLSDKRVGPAGLGARDTLRLEMGYSLCGQDINEQTTPLEAGLECFIDFNKSFIGGDALLRQKEKGLSKKLVCFITNTRQSPRHNDKIFLNNQEIGIVTSGSFSPSLSCGIGMGYIRTGCEEKNLTIMLKEGKREISAFITDKPFYKQGSLKN